MKFLISFLAGLALCFLSLIIIERLSRPQGLSDEQIHTLTIQEIMKSIEQWIEDEDNEDKNE